MTGGAAAREGEGPGGRADETVEASSAVVDVTTAEDLVPSVFEWIADVGLVVHTIEEYRVVPWAPTADDMWELGKLTSERLGALMKVYRVARAHGLAFEARAEQLDRHLMFSGATAKTWHEVVVFEAVVGPFFRLFFESLFRSVSPDVDTLARDLWAESQRFIRFGQAHMAKALARGERAEIQAALEKWLPVAVDSLVAVSADVDTAWRTSGLRTRSSDQVRQDYLDEVVTYLRGNDLEIPPHLRDAIPEVEVKWLGLEVAGGGRRDGPLKTATFAFTDRVRQAGDGGSGTSTTERGAT